MFLKVSGKMHAVDSVERAARMYRQIWDKTVQTSGRIIRGATIVVDGIEVYRISQNGKVWEGDYRPGQVPVFELAAEPRETT